jgi:hypothetical protein
VETGAAYSRYLTWVMPEYQKRLPQVVTTAPVSHP